MADLAEHCRFFQNRQCEYFPCHTGVDTADFNCLFCYCPLYALGEACGGNCRYTADGTKDCSECTFPHRRQNYDRVLARYGELRALAARSGAVADSQTAEENNSSEPPLYRSPFEAYPYLSEPADDLRCDFELMTDEMASLTGLLRAKTADPALQAELLWLCELIYHLNPALRTGLKVTPAEQARLQDAVERLRAANGARCRRFVLTQGCEAACLAHVLRVRAKELVRLLYRHARQGHPVPPMLLDLANLLSGYFFYLALQCNAEAGVDEVDFISRNY